MDQNSVAVKIGYNGELHRLRVDLNAFTLDALSRLFVHTFRLTPGAFVIKYTDAEGDTLNVVSDAEFVEACRVFLSGNSDELKALKFTAVARGNATATAAAPQNPADPLIDAVEKLVQTLNVTVDKVRAEEWKDGVEVATEALSQAATDVKRTLEAARASVQEKPFEAVLEETSDGLKSAASGISSFAQRFVKTFISEKKPEATNQQQQQAPPAPAPVAVAVVEEKAEEAPAAAFEVQEEIAEAVAVEAAEPEAAAVPVPASVEASVPVVAFSDTEIKWADHLSTVRAIFPDVATATAVESLERNGGDVNVVINELMEEMM